MASLVSPNRVRMAGAGFTLFTFGGQPIAFCQQVSHTSPRPIAPPSYIQPMDEPYTVEVLQLPAAGPGTLTLNLYELFGSDGNASKMWDRLGANLGGGTGVQNPFGTTGPGNASSQLGGLTPGTGPFAGAVDIVDIFLRQAQMLPEHMGITKIIRPLPTVSTNGTRSAIQPYTEDYVGCVITDVVDGEDVMVGTKELVKQITVAYRYLLRDGHASQAFAVRDGAMPNITPGAV